jgi:hypothetical protein
MNVSTQSTPRLNDVYFDQPDIDLRGSPEYRRATLMAKTPYNYSYVQWDKLEDKW